MPNLKIEGFFHYGISVNNLEKVSNFFSDQLSLNLVASREIRANYIEDLVGAPGVWAEVKMFEIGNSSYLELLQWHGRSNEKKTAQGSITSIGAQHLCVYVSDADSLFKSLKKLEVVEIVSRKVTMVTEGPNVGAKIFFILVDGILFIELFQKPTKQNI
jgi:hypothetical protein